jgi:thiosulfate/3-mercaptopyruvate sulfurtransferase
MTAPLVTSAWLYDNLNDPDLVILDASPATNNASLQAEQGDAQIPSARFFDLKHAFSDGTNELPNTLPSAEQFEAACRELGINASSKIVVYDNLGVYASPRVWWMFKVMGHENVAVLNGGLPDWQAQGFETVSGKDPQLELGNFSAAFQSDMVVDHTTVKSNLKTKSALLIDARSTGRFDGTAPEPRPGLRSGHIPDSFNLPYTEVLADGKFKSQAELAALFSTLRNEERPLVFSCGSGVTACIDLLACELVLPNHKAVYDGSWTEWAQRESAS